MSLNARDYLKAAVLKVEDDGGGIIGSVRAYQEKGTVYQVKPHFKHYIQI